MPPAPPQTPPSEPRQVASVALFRDGKMLWIRRRDTGKLTLPGGHLLPGEEPLDGARRELLEETGIDSRNLEYLGDGEAGGPDNPLRVHAFRCEDPNGGDPHPALDPDREAAAYEWRDPDDCPPDDDAAVPNHRNVTLACLGSGPADGLPGLDTLAKAERGRKEWRGKDGLRIPHHQDPARKAWDRAYRDKLVEVFGAGNPKRLRPVRVPITPYLSGTNAVKSRDRHQLYQRMLRGGDRLPPIVVRRNGQSWHVIDGNHRTDAALLHGLPQLDAYELLDADHPDLKKALADRIEESPVAKAVGIPEILAHLDRLRTRIREIADTSQASSWGTKAGATVVVARDPHDRLRWRATRLDPEGLPAGHQVASSYEEALRHAHDQGADLHAEPLKMLKSEKDGDTFLLMKAEFQPAFRHRVTGSVYVTPAIHNYDDLRHHVEMDEDWQNPDEWEEGFVDKQGLGDFHTRSEAAAKVFPTTAARRAASKERMDTEELESQDYLYGVQRGVLKAETDLVAAATASLDDSLRRPRYQGNPNHLAGHCYVASEALYHLMGGKESGWVPQTIRHEGDTHWYLRHRETGEILDPTAGQFKTPVPYERGRGSGFLTRQPSKRAAELISRIEARRALDRRPAGR